MKIIIMSIVATLAGSIGLASTGDSVTAPVVNPCACQPGDTAFRPEAHPVAQDVGVFAAKLDPDWAMTPALLDHRGMGCMFTGPYEVRHVRGVGAVVFRVDPHTPVGFRFLIEVSTQTCDVFIDLDGGFGDLQMRYVCDSGYYSGGPRDPVTCRPLAPMSRELTEASAPRRFRHLSPERPTAWP